MVYINQNGKEVDSEGKEIVKKMMNISSSRDMQAKKDAKFGRIH